MMMHYSGKSILCLILCIWTVSHDEPLLYSSMTCSVLEHYHKQNMIINENCCYVQQHNQRHTLIFYWLTAKIIASLIILLTKYHQGKVSFASLVAQLYVIYICFRWEYTNSPQNIDGILGDFTHCLLDIAMSCKILILGSLFKRLTIFNLSL